MSSARISSSRIQSGFRRRSSTMPKLRTRGNLATIMTDNPVELDEDRGTVRS
jgi:hypothetical protein